MDNVMIERLWRSLKYECIIPHASETASEIRKGFSPGLTFTTPNGLSRSLTTRSRMKHIGMVLETVEIMASANSVIIPSMWMGMFLSVRSATAGAWILPAEKPCRLPISR